MQYSRKISVKSKGKIYSARLQFSAPVEEENHVWYCSWICDFFHSREQRIYGKDAIEAMHNCLNFIDWFFFEMSKTGLEILRDNVGDNGGFTFNR